MWKEVDQGWAYSEEEERINYEAGSYLKICLSTMARKAKEHLEAEYRGGNEVRRTELGEVGDRGPKLEKMKTCCRWPMLQTRSEKAISK